MPADLLVTFLWVKSCAFSIGLLHCKFWSAEKCQSGLYFPLPTCVLLAEPLSWCWLQLDIFPPKQSLKHVALVLCVPQNALPLLKVQNFQGVKLSVFSSQWQIELAVGGPLPRTGFLQTRWICMGSTPLAYLCEMAAQAWDVIFCRGTAVALATSILGSNEAS